MARLIGFSSPLSVVVAMVWAFSGQASAAKPLRLITDAYLGHSENIADDKAPGFSIEVIRQVFATMGEDVSFEVFPANRVRMMILSGERDGRFPITFRDNDQSRPCALPDEPLGRTSWAVFIRTADVGKLKFVSFDDLVGHDVAASGSNAPGLPDQPVLPPELRSFFREHHNLVVTNGTPESLRMLAAGRVDYAVENLNFGTRAIRTMGLSATVEPLLSHLAFEAGFYVCFSKVRVDPDFVDKFSHALKEFKQTEAFQVIYRKYFP